MEGVHSKEPAASLHSETSSSGLADGLRLKGSLPVLQALPAQRTCCPTSGEVNRSEPTGVLPTFGAGVGGLTGFPSLGAERISPSKI